MSWKKLLYSLPVVLAVTLSCSWSSGLLYGLATEIVRPPKITQEKPKRSSRRMANANSSPLSQWNCLSHTERCFAEMPQRVMEIISARSQTSILFIHCHSKGRCCFDLQSLLPPIPWDNVFSHLISSLQKQKERRASER